MGKGLPQQEGDKLSTQVKKESKKKARPRNGHPRIEKGGEGRTKKEKTGNSC